MKTAREIACALCAPINMPSLTTCAAAGYQHTQQCDRLTAAIEARDAEHANALDALNTAYKSLGASLGHEQHARVEMSRERDAALALATKAELAYAGAVAERDEARRLLTGAKADLSLCRQDRTDFAALATTSKPAGELDPGCVKCIKCRGCVGACDCTGGPQTEAECTCYELTGGHQPGCYYNARPSASAGQEAAKPREGLEHDPLPAPQSLEARYREALEEAKKTFVRIEEIVHRADPDGTSRAWHDVDVLVFMAAVDARAALATPSSVPPPANVRVVTPREVAHEVIRASWEAGDSSMCSARGPFAKDHSATCDLMTAAIQKRDETWQAIVEAMTPAPPVPPKETT